MDIIIDGKKMGGFFKIIFILHLFFVSCSNTNNRNTITFKVPIAVMGDSIKVMNSLVNPYAEFNYYIDDVNVLYLSNHMIGKIDSSFLAQIKLKPSNYSKNDVRIFSLILFLKNNEINSCFKLTELGVLVYDYKPTKEDRFEDIRYILLENDHIDINSMRFRNSYITLDKKNGLILIAPIDKRK